MKQIIIVMVFSLVLDNLYMSQAPDNDWFGVKHLGPNYLFKWRTDDSNKGIVIRVEVMTKGWVAFGFSKHGKTTETDLVIGWVNDMGRTTFNDFWVNEFGSRSVDTSQDWILISGTENATHTSLEFKRNYITCDVENDLEIFDNEYEPSNIVFSYGFIDPPSVESIGKSAVEGVDYIQLFSLEETPEEKDIQVFDFTINTTLPKRNSNLKAPIILCKLFKNNFKIRQTIVASQPSTIPSNIGLNHHRILHSCGNHLDETVAEKFVGSVFPCLDQNDPLHFLRAKKCDEFSIVTGILSDQKLDFPPKVGVSFDPVQMPYFLIESHVINTQNIELDVLLTVRLWMTKQPRNSEAGIKVLSGATGMEHSNWGFIVPPKQTSFTVSSVIDSYCFENQQFEQNGGIHIFSLIFHTHSALTQEVRHYRDDKLKRDLRYNHYVSDEQTYRTFKESIHFIKGDKLVILCEYNTMENTKSITAPIQHCLITFYYYPKIISENNYYWSRIPYKTMLSITGLQQISNYENETLDNIVISKPDEFANTKLVDFVADNKYKIKDPKVLEEFLISSSLSQCCHFHYPQSGVLDKPCKNVSKPPGLFHSIINRRKENSCNSPKHLIQRSEKSIESNNNHKAIENLKKTRLSFRLLMNSFKLFFDLNNS